MHIKQFTFQLKSFIEKRTENKKNCMIFFGIYSLSLETNQAEENFGARGQDRRGEMKCALN